MDKRVGSAGVELSILGEGPDKLVYLVAIREDGN